MNALTNLDQKAAFHSQEMVKSAIEEHINAKDIENLVTKALGVLQSQGVYAAMLYLFSRGSEQAKIAAHIRKHLLNLLKEIGQFRENEELKKILPDSDDEPDITPQQILNFYITQICSDLNTLLLVKDLYEQALIYARYGAKAEKD